jgi:hypothetical protein
MWERHFRQINEKLDLIIKNQTIEKGARNKMAVTLDDILANAKDETTVDNSIIALLNSISAQLTAAGQDPAKLQAVNDLITANKAAIAAAVVANTPAAPPAA